MSVSKKGGRAMEKIFFYDFPIGKLGVEKIGIAEKDNKISKIFHTKDELIGIGEIFHDGNNEILEETPLILKCKKQLDEYFNNKRKKFMLPLLFEGTDFQIKIWEELCKVPYGDVISYAELGRRAGYQNAARAVGNCIQKSNHVIILPCHRVIKSDNTLGSYGSMPNIKKRLLAFEGSYEKLKKS